MKIKALKCPQCGDSVGIKRDAEFIFCSTCGSKLVINDIIQSVDYKQRNKNALYLGLKVASIVLLLAIFAAIWLPLAHLQSSTFMGDIFIINGVVYSLHREHFPMAIFMLSALGLVLVWEVIALVLHIVGIVNGNYFKYLNKHVSCVTQIVGAVLLSALFFGFSLYCIGSSEYTLRVGAYIQNTLVVLLAAVKAVLVVFMWRSKSAKPKS